MMKYISIATILLISDSNAIKFRPVENVPETTLAIGYDADIEMTKSNINEVEKTYG